MPRAATRPRREGMEYASPSRRGETTCTRSAPGISRDQAALEIGNDVQSIGSIGPMHVTCTG
jgi:hypothetical protein